ncbi:hypothetical protein FS842_004124 [Serendipita sp. 407]|nr:hypothetical protein FS842_004124 [Serendipita sp. 407]
MAPLPRSELTITTTTLLFTIYSLVDGTSKIASATHDTTRPFGNKSCFGSPTRPVLAFRSMCSPTPFDANSL